MKNTKSLSELVAITAVEFLKGQNEDVKVMYASEDGFAFIEENRVQVHCKKVKDLKYHTITRIEALQGIQSQDPEDNEDDDTELQDLKAEYEKLFGKAAHHNIGVEKLKTLIAEKLAESGNQNPEGDNNNQQA